MEVKHFEFRFGVPTLNNAHRYRGRNGQGICRGVAFVAEPEHGMVTLQPINSKGAVSDACAIELPADPTLLREIGTFILGMAAGFAGQDSLEEGT